MAEAAKLFFEYMYIHMDLVDKTGKRKFVRIY